MRRTSGSSSWASMIRQVWYGDDHINPKKLLERQYLYRSFLALRLRELMMMAAENATATATTSITSTTTTTAAAAASESLSASSNSSSSSSTTALFDELYEAATADLERRQYGKLPNVDLRNQLHALLRPQIQAMFQSIRTVDQDQLGIRYCDIDNCTEDGTTVTGILTKEDSFYRDILLKEHDMVQQQTSSTKNPHRQYFFDTKSTAIETVLQFHGWKDYPTNPLLKSPAIDAFGMDMTKYRHATEAATSSSSSSSTSSSASSNNNSSSSSNNNNNNNNRIALIRHHQTLNLCRSALLREKLGYSVVSLRSSIAGRGLFIDGSVLPGTILALFPGDVWPKEHLLTNAPDVMDHFENDEDSHISLRFDDYVIDARQSPVTVLSKPASCNPYALAHMANHAGNATMISCQSTMLEYDDRMIDDSCLPYIPNTYARPPTWQSRFFFGFGKTILMHGLSLLSLKKVSNQELFYDYRLQSDDTPDWYQAIPDETMPQVVFFRNDWQEQPPR